MARAPQERRYESQVDAGGAARLTGVSPEAFGAGIGRSAAQLGGVLHRANVEAKELEAQRQYESDFAAGTKAVAEFKLEARKKALDM
jgi:hypothetical protein